MNSNLILIGMPGSGKSTIGVILAKYLSKSFIDTDLLIQAQYEMPLQQIIHEHGYLKLREYEEQIILQTHPNNAVIATGGSAVYSSKAMAQLKRDGVAVYLVVPLAELLRRVKNFSTRGIACSAEQSFGETLKERTVLYEQYADIAIDCDGMGHEKVVQEIMNRLPQDSIG